MNKRINELQNAVDADIVNKFFKANITNTHDLQMLDEIRLSMIANDHLFKGAITVLRQEMIDRGLS